MAVAVAAGAVAVAAEVVSSIRLKFGDVGHAQLVPPSSKQARRGFQLRNLLLGCQLARIDQRLES